MKLLMAALAAFLLVAQPAQAKHHRHHHHTRIASQDVPGCVWDNNGRQTCQGPSQAYEPSRVRSVRSYDGGSRVCDSSHRHCASVASSAQPILQCVLDHVEAAGVRITALGGIRPGRCSTASMHPCGKALDINQTARDVNGPPRYVSSAAALACGAVSGSWWSRNPDNGHFQVGGWAGTHGEQTFAAERQSYHRTATR